MKTDQPGASTKRADRRAAIGRIRKPYLILVADVDDRVTVKTGFGLRDWIPDDLVGQWRFGDGAIDLGLRDLDAAGALAAGARSVVIGAAPSGGQLPDHWVAALVEAARLGLDIVSGLHSRLAAIPMLVEAAVAGGATLHDIRHPPADLPIGTGGKRAGRRLLTVGTDCAVGKKYAALAIARALGVRGASVDFRATGQTGILIAGGGIAIDAVVADFLAGAAELLSPAADPGHWDIIEGQGSLFHPSYAGVALGLLHGSQPDALVLCHDPDRYEIDGCRGFPLPDIATAIAQNVEAARLTNPAVRCVGIALNTSRHSEDEALGLLERIAAVHGLPAIDPLRFGAGAIAATLA